MWDSVNIQWQPVVLRVDSPLGHDLLQGTPIHLISPGVANGVWMWDGSKWVVKVLPVSFDHVENRTPDLDLKTRQNANIDITGKAEFGSEVYMLYLNIDSSVGGISLVVREGVVLKGYSATSSTGALLYTDGSGIVRKLETLNDSTKVLRGDMTWGPASDADWLNTSTSTPPLSINDNIYTYGRVGVGTNNPLARLHVADDGMIYAQGTFGLGDTVPAGNKVAFIWNPRKAVIRGGAAGDHWNEANLGQYSVAFGSGNIAKGLYSVVLNGEFNVAGDRAYVLGGDYDTATGIYSVVTGLKNSTQGDYSWVGGRGMRLDSSADRTFVWGHNASSNPPLIKASNAFLIGPNGEVINVGIGLDSPTNILTVVQNSPTDPIADAWTTYSTPETKIVLGTLKDTTLFRYLQQFKVLPIYAWKRSENEPVRLSVMAQEGTPTEVMAYDANGNIQGIDLQGYIGFLHVVVRAQQELIDSQQKEIVKYGERLASLEKKLKSQEEQVAILKQQSEQIKALQEENKMLRERLQQIEAIIGQFHTDRETQKSK